MALSNLFGWAKKTPAASACGTACGCGDDRGQRPKQGVGAGAAASESGDPPKGRTDCWVPQPGAADKQEKKPAACGTACGAGDKPAEKKKPAACGTGCGASDK